MTSRTSEELARLMSGIRLLMLDFDGPICSVFATLPAPVVADRLRRSLRGLGVQMTSELERDNDPLSIYRHSAAYGEVIMTQIYKELVQAELQAVVGAEPTPGATELVEATKATGRRVAIVSNNAAAAVEFYVDEHRLTPHIDHIAARRTPEPHRMKPDPALLLEAASVLAVEPHHCALIGDSTTDIVAANRAGVRAIGFANRPGKQVGFELLDPDALILGLDSVVRVL